MKHHDRVPALWQFAVALVTLCLFVALCLAAQKNPRDGAYSPDDRAALSAVMGADTAAITRATKLVYLFGDDGQAVKYPCKICN